MPVPSPRNIAAVVAGLARGGGLRRFLSGHLRLSPEEFLWPVVVDVTEGCNLACSMCRPGGGGRTRTAPAAVFRSLEKTVLPRAAEMSFGCRHEALLHPGLAGSLARLNAARRRLGRPCGLFLLTSGTLLTRDMSRRLLSAGLDSILLSIQSTHEKTFAALQPPASWPAVASRLAGFLAAARFSATAAGVQMLLMKRTLGRLASSVRDLAGLGFRDLWLAQMIAAPPPADADVILLASARGRSLRAALARARAEASRLGVRLREPQAAPAAPRGDLVPLFCEGHVWDEPLLARSGRGICVLPWCKLRIDHSGEVFPCPLITDPSLSWGNILHGGVDEAVNGERAVRMRRDLLRGSAPNHLCARCPVGPAGGAGACRSSPSTRTRR